MKKITELVKLTSDEENLLKQNFIKKLDDKNFVELTNTLNCGDDVLMKYTSSLEDAALEFGNCQKCMGLAECKNKLCGYAYLPIEKDSLKKLGNATVAQCKLLLDTHIYLLKKIIILLLNIKHVYIK